MFLPPDHSLRARFARLTQQEERHGLLADTATIGTRTGWEARLREAGFHLRGHRLVKKALVSRRHSPSHSSSE
jgi:hypothetical protein